eukprot:3360155-Rhodomonas_salina.3
MYPIPSHTCPPRAYESPSPCSCRVWRRTGADNNAQPNKTLDALTKICTHTNADNKHGKF